MLLSNAELNMESGTCLLPRNLVERIKKFDIQFNTDFLQRYPDIVLHASIAITTYLRSGIQFTGRSWNRHNAKLWYRYSMIPLIYERQMEWNVLRQDKYSYVLRSNPNAGNASGAFTALFMRLCLYIQKCLKVEHKVPILYPRSAAIVTSSTSTNLQWWQGRRLTQNTREREFYERHNSDEKFCGIGVFVVWI